MPIKLFQRLLFQTNFAVRAMNKPHGRVRMNNSVSLYGDIGYSTVLTVN